MSLPRTTSSNCTFNPTAYLTSQTQNVQSQAPALLQAPCPQLSCLLPSSYSVLKPWSYPWFHSFFYTHIQFISKTCELKQSVGTYPEADHVSQAKHNHFGPNCCHLSLYLLSHLTSLHLIVKLGGSCSSKKLVTILCKNKFLNTEFSWAKQRLKFHLRFDFIVNIYSWVLAVTFSTPFWGTFLTGIFTIY